MVPWHTTNRKHFSDEISGYDANLLTDPGLQLRHLCLQLGHAPLEFFDFVARGQMEVLRESCPLGCGKRAKSLWCLNQQSQKLQCLFTL